MAPTEKKSSSSSQKTRPKLQAWKATEKPPRKKPEPKGEARCELCRLKYSRCEKLHCNGIPCDHGKFYRICNICLPMTPFRWKNEVKQLRRYGSDIKLPRKVKLKRK
jgi:hypothetical protein